ncbi:MAG: hypothetical protein GX617_02720 [Lentisphaerae bacterium]|nr:hypothetical protein [Lentisphaerota bacterium]
MNRSAVMSITLPLLLAAAGCQSVSHNVVASYPAPPEEAATSQYRVTVNGLPLAVYTAKCKGWGDEYYFASFDLDGKAEVVVNSPSTLAKTEIHPLSRGIVPEQRSDNEWAFTVDRPGHLVIKRDGRVMPLMLFVNPREKDIPNPNDPNVVFFGPGFHQAGKITLKDNQTLYIAGGAVVSGGIRAEGDNITIRGRGILAGDAYERFKGPNRYPVDIYGGKNITIRDIIIRNPWSWTLVTCGSDGVLIDNVKICAANMINDDAIDLCNTRNAVVRNCFLRAQDDLIAIKGIGYAERQECENILVEDCVFWCDVANPFRIGFECATKAMRNFTARDIDIVHYSQRYSGPAEFWAHAIFWLQPSGGLALQNYHFEDIRIHCNGDDMVMVMAKLMLTSCNGKKYETYGSISDCSFKNITVTGTPGAFRGELFFQGFDADHRVSNVSFDNVSYFGQKILRDSPAVIIKDFADGIVFK